MKENVLVIMAAGIGSRFGGIKQLTPVGPGGEIIMEYSIYDAIRAGFKKVIFIIRKDIEKDFKEIIGDRISRYIETEYVFQDPDALPAGYRRPEGRTKPWGTGQAILSCLGKLDAPFAVINADDYYGREGFQVIHDFLSNPGSSDKKYHFCMAGFVLGNTLSDFGTVTRGVCTVNEHGKLVNINETAGIYRDGAMACTEADGKRRFIPYTSPVSMNMWGFTPELLPELEQRFAGFLDHMGENDLKAEYLLPEVVDSLIKEGLAEVTVLHTDDKWFGVTYQEDKQFVMDSFAALTAQGVYPEYLFPENGHVR